MEQGVILPKKNLNFITIANKQFKIANITEDIRKAELFIEERFKELQGKYPERFKSSSKKAKGESIEYEAIQLLMNITMEYLGEKQKIEELKKEMNVKIESLINRVELLL